MRLDMADPASQLPGPDGSTDAGQESPRGGGRAPEVWNESRADCSHSATQG